jgi:hypothetical protein
MQPPRRPHGWHTTATVRGLLPRLGDAAASHSSEQVSSSRTKRTIGASASTPARELPGRRTHSAATARRRDAARRRDGATARRRRVGGQATPAGGCTGSLPLRPGLAPGNLMSVLFYLVCSNFEITQITMPPWGFKHYGADHSSVDVHMISSLEARPKPGHQDGHEPVGKQRCNFDTLNQTSKRHQQALGTARCSQCSKHNSRNSACRRFRVAVGRAYPKSIDRAAGRTERRAPGAARSARHRRPSRCIRRPGRPAPLADARSAVVCAGAA